jgi:outer membrane murein-binding lipoprotein Lpp
MKITTHKNIVLGAGLLGISTVIGIANPAQAAPRNNDVRQERRDVKQARKDVKQERKDVGRADTPAERRREQRDVQQAREELREERQDLRQERREDRRPNQPGWNNRPNYNRPNYNRPNYNRPGYGGGAVYPGSRGYTGTVTRVRSSQSFDVNIGGNIFNVYLVNLAPRGLSVGDIVRVNGVQQYNNDIRNAGVTIVNNR